MYHDQLKTAEPYNQQFFREQEQYAADNVIQFPNTKPAKKQVEEYTPFPGICLTDTFQLGETKEGEELFSEIFPQNSQRVIEQQKTPLRIIIGNPPYSVGQKSANDKAKNQEYKLLDERISNTYVANSITTMNKANYDAYIKAFRWATDRLDINGGIICFVSNAGWLDGNTAAGFRKCLEQEFTSIYAFNLRGNQRTSGELSRKEGGKIFGGGSRTPISIALLVKNPKHKIEKANIHYYDIGDYHSREKKLQIIKDFSTVDNIKWKILLPNEKSDWLFQRNNSYLNFIPLADKSGQEMPIFSFNSNGIVTGRDAWVYNSSEKLLKKNVTNMIEFYNNQRAEYKIKLKTNKSLKAKDFISSDETKIKWVENLIKSFEKDLEIKFSKNEISRSNYRPFFKQFYYYNKQLNWSRYLQPNIFPNNNTDNKIICVSGIGASKGFSVLISDYVPNYHYLDTMQTFPLYWYKKKEKVQGSLFEKTDEEYTRHDAISDFILEQTKTRYGPKIIKEDIFYYVYGILHSPDYRKTFANDLKKMLPRLPLVEKVGDFWAFSKAGRNLAEIHLNYEEQEPPKEVLINGKTKPKTPFPANQLVVNKMSFPSKGQKDTIIYNSYLTVSNIPAKAYEYIVNGKSAIEWVMERYSVTTHKESGITNDPNDWAKEHEDPQYILNLLLSVITVSVKTVEVVEGLPKVEWGIVYD